MTSLPSMVNVATTHSGWNVSPAQDDLAPHPLGFLASDLPYVAAAMEVHAQRQEALQSLKALNYISGGSKEISEQIARLQSNKRLTTHEILAATPKLSHQIQRNAITHTAEALRTMRDMADSTLFGSSEASEAQLRGYFAAANQHIDEAIALWDEGKTEAAMAAYAEAMAGIEGHSRWIQCAYEKSEFQKFGAHIGTTAGAAVLTALTGGVATPALASAIGAATGGCGYLALGTLVNGLAFTTSLRSLNSLVFDKAFFPKTTVTENVADFAGDVAHATALFGWMHGVGVLGRALPVYEGEMAAAMTAIKNFGWEYTGLTGFNLYSTAALQVFDPDAPGMEAVVSKEALVQNLAFLAGLKVGGQMMGGALRVLPQLPGLVIDTVRPAWDSALARFAQVAAPAPLMVMLGREINPIRLLFKWLETNHGKRPPIVLGMVNVNVSYAVSLGLRLFAATTFPEWADALPFLFQKGADPKFFTWDNLFTTWWQINLFSLAVVIPAFVGMGAFSTKISSVKHRPEDFPFRDMSGAQITQAYFKEFALRGIFGVTKLAGFHYGAYTGRAIGWGIDILGNGGSDIANALLFKPSTHFYDLFVPGAILSVLMAVANTIVSQHPGFSHSHQYAERIKMGILRTGVYRGFCVSDTLSTGLNLAIQSVFGLGAVIHALRVTR